MVGRPPHLTARLSNLGLLLRLRPFSTIASNNPDKAPAAADAAARNETYRQLQNLDFTTAAKILFTSPPKRKKFGFDFHIVQFFFACMPSLAVYLVAQYARYEIRRMEAEAELKKKQAEEEEKVKAAELGLIEEGSDSDLSKVIVRLDALEEAVKEIADERKKATPSNTPSGQEVGKEVQVSPADKNSNLESKLKAGELTPDRSSKTIGGSSPAAVPAGDAKKVENTETSSKEAKK